ncbi:MAG TPA: hypothetical protein VM124_00055 [Candidatus Limnocylindrales bacterium]|nr:hypothetical protein [Candidatus Limnocylindrales bacterium]
MSTTEALSSPIQKPFREVFDALNQRSESEGAPMYLLGHGTSHNEPSDFFKNGLEMWHPEKGNYGDIFAMSIGLDLNDVDGTQAKLNSWPHHRTPNVVLLAVSAPGDELDELQQHFYFEGMVQHSGRTKTSLSGEEEEVTHVPPEWVLGVYDSSSGLVAMNPGFSGRRVLPEDFEKSAGDKYERHIAQAKIVAKYGLMGLVPGGMEPDKKADDIPDVTLFPEDVDLPGDDDWVW